MVDNAVIGETAKRIRLKQRLSQKDAADRLDITPVHLCNIEKGKTQPSPKLVDRFREVFGADLYVVAWLLYGNIESLPAGTKEATRRLASAWRQELDWQE